MKKTPRHRLMFYILAMVMAAALLPVTVLAEEPTEHDINSGSIIITEPGDYIITGETTTNTITVAAGVSADITLNNVNIDVSNTDNACAFLIEDNSTGDVSITLSGDNILKSGRNRAGIQKNGSGDGIGTLTIGGEGTLTATGGGGDYSVGAAGIGGGRGGSSSYIIINGGTVTANSGNGAGIGGGGGSNASGGSHITINNGIVTANGNWRGAGIGGGIFNSGSHITINGGTVTAIGEGYGDGIGGGEGSNGSHITINGGTVTAISGFYGAGIDSSNGVSISPTEGKIIRVDVGSSESDTTKHIYIEETTYEGKDRYFHSVEEGITYTIEAISDQTMSELTEGYDSGFQETKTITVTRTGTGVLNNLTAALSGDGAESFEITEPPADTLDYTTISTTLSVKAIDGLAAGTYTATVTVSADNMEDVSFTVTQVINEAYVAVTDITTVPETATVGENLMLSGRVVPDNATNQTIVWSIEDQGDTGAIISGNTLSTTAAGTATVRATITNGASESSDYTKVFTITVSESTVDKTLISITTPDAVTGIANGTAKTASALGLPSTVEMVTDDGILSAEVTWDVDGICYDPDNTAEQSFTLTGTVTLPDGVINPDSVELTVSISVTVDAATSGGGSRRSSTAAPTPEPAPVPKEFTAEITGGSGDETTLAVDIHAETGRATVQLETLAAKLFSNEEAVVITVPDIEGINSYTLDLPASDLAEGQGEGQLTFSTELGNITIADNMLAAMDGIEEREAAITISQGDISDLPTDVKTAIGNRPLLQLTLTLDGEQANWNNPAAPVTVSIPFTPTAAELADPEHIVVWYIDGSGNVVSIPNGRYNAETGTVTFSTTHFSYYAVAYVHKTFADLGSVEWARKPIEVMASKGIINGTSATTYSPAANITRADYLLLLVKTLGLTADFDTAHDGNFADVEPGTYYYETIGIAKKLGLASGVGGNHFNPKEHISRQEMMVLTARALENFKGLEVTEDSSVLDKFIDKDDIAGYAVTSLATLVNEGLIAGDGNNLNPHGQTTRAEAAVFLHRIYTK